MRVCLVNPPASLKYPRDPSSPKSPNLPRISQSAQNLPVLPKSAQILSRHLPQPIRMPLASQPTMAAAGVSRVYEILTDLNRRRAIPIIHQATLEERLVIVCKPLDRLPRLKVPRPNLNVKSHYRQRRAQRVYLEVLDEDPCVFLAFILAISPRACESFDLRGFRQQHQKQSGTHLNDELKSTLDAIAEKQHFKQSPYYERLIESLFPGPYAPFHFCDHANRQASLSLDSKTHHDGR